MLVLTTWVCLLSGWNQGGLGQFGLMLPMGSIQGQNLHPGLLVTETDSFPAYGNTFKWFFENTSSPEICEIHLPSLRGSLPNMQTVQKCTSQATFFSFLFFKIRYLRLKSIQLSRFTCYPVGKCQETHFYQTRLLHQGNIWKCIWSISLFLTLQLSPLSQGHVSAQSPIPMTPGC